METTEYILSRPAKVKFRGNNVINEGILLFAEGVGDGWFNPVKTLQFTFRFNNAEETEKSIDLFNIDIITFL